MGVNRVMLLVSVVLGVLAMLLAFIYMSTMEGAGGDGAGDGIEQEQTVEIVQVIRDLPTGHKLSVSSDLKKIAVPRDTFASLVQSSVRASDLPTIDGRILGMPAAAGQPLTYAHFSLTRDIELGIDRRAYALEVGGAAALQGLLMPGDHIDLIVLRPKRVDALEAVGVDSENLTNEQTAQLAQAQLGSIFSQMARDLGGRDGYDPEIILENVKVIAIGNRLAGSRLSMIGQSRGRVQKSDMITLDVSLEEALMLAEESSQQFRVLLRPSKRVEVEAAPSGGGLRGLQPAGG